MAKSLAFKLAEISRHIYYDATNDDIVVSKEIVSSRRKSGSTTTTATTQVALDTFVHGTYTTARYIVSVTQGSHYHSTEIVICLLYTSPSPRDVEESRMPSSA